MFHIYLAAAYIYVLWRFIFRLPIRFKWRVSLAVVFLLVSKYHLILVVAYGTMFSPELPRAAILIIGWLFCTFIFVLLLTILRDLVGLAMRPWCKTAPIIFVDGKGEVAIVIAALALAAIGVFQAAQVPNVKRVEVAIKKLPEALDGVRIVHLTDLHISRMYQADWVKDVVSRTNALKPDLILITGDLIDGTVETRREDVAPLGRLKSKLGVLITPGNHEYYFDGARWLDEFRLLGLRVLVNEHVILNAGSAELVIAGVTDEAAPAFGMSGPDLQRALKAAPSELPLILLKHRPLGAISAADAGVGLQLSGHTHGGMIRGLDLIARYANEGFVSGIYNVGEMKLYVSSGTGLWNGFPIRLGVPSEITELTLRSIPPLHNPQSE